MQQQETVHRLLSRGERPLAKGIPEGRRIALVSEGQRYVFTKCISQSLRTAGYDSLMREQTVSGTSQEYFRPNAIQMETFVEPGDTIQVLEVDHEHGFIHVTLEIIRGQRYVIDRVIPLNELHSNPEKFIVAPLHSEDGVQPARVVSPGPLLDAETALRIVHSTEASLV